MPRIPYLFGEEQRRQEEIRRRIAENVVVFIDSGMTGGGLLVSHGLVISNYHILKGNITASRMVRSQSRARLVEKKAKLVLADKNLDLAALSVDFRVAEFPVITCQARERQTVYMMVPIWNKPRIDIVPFEGTIEQVTENRIYAQMLSRMGSCGSGIFDACGAVVAVADTDVQVQSTQGIPGRILKDFIKKACKRIREDRLPACNPANQGRLPYGPGEGTI